ncbi:hypothetical protein ACIRO3_23255 [Streptomyces sp. NPDC102278]
MDNGPGMVSTESAWLNTVTRSGQTEAEFLTRLHLDTSTPRHLDHRLGQP